MRTEVWRWDEQERRGRRWGGLAFPVGSERFPRV